MEDIIQMYVKALQKGSQEAFNAIYEMYADKLYGFVYAHTKSQQISRDIVQDTFLRLWVNRKSISTEGSLQSLLFTIARNKMIDIFRTQLNTVEFDMFVELREENQFYDDKIDEKLDYDDFLNMLKLCKKFLSERELEIFELNKEKGFSVDEIADQLSISVQTVKNQLTNSLKKIRIQFQKINMYNE